MSFRLSKRAATAWNCLRAVADWSFLANHVRVLPSIAHDPGARLRDIAAGLGITERSAPIVTERRGSWMSSPSQPVHLSNHHRNTMGQILQHPAGHNIEWHAVLSLLERRAQPRNNPGGKVAVTIGSQTE